MGLPGREASLGDFVVNFSMLQSWIPGFKDVDGVYWTLAVELTFYALMFGLYLLRRLQQVEWFAVAWLAIAVLVLTTPIAETRAGTALNFLLVLNHSGYFVCGSGRWSSSCSLVRGS